MQIRRILSPALKIAVRQERIFRNPCTLIETAAEGSPETETLHRNRGARRLGRVGLEP